LIEGDRISPAQLQSELKSANVKLIGAFCGDDLVGSVVVTRKGPLRASIGMLNVLPQQQNFGVGKTLMEAAESVFDVDTLELVVLAKVCLVLCWTKFCSFVLPFTFFFQRTELIGWYKKRGFALVEGKTEQFPIGQGFGHPRPNAFDVYEGVPFFATMEKKLK
jgi:GNAT superfamily N-acetyltransferase